MKLEWFRMKYVKRVEDSKRTWGEKSKAHPRSENKQKIIFLLDKRKYEINCSVNNIFFCLFIHFLSASFFSTRWIALLSFADVTAYFTAVWQIIFLLLLFSILFVFKNLCDSSAINKVSVRPSWKSDAVLCISDSCEDLPISLIV